MFSLAGTDEEHYPIVSVVAIVLTHFKTEVFIAVM
jgi:hypothetical protein